MKDEPIAAITYQNRLRIHAMRHEHGVISAKEAKANSKTSAQEFLASYPGVEVGADEEIVDFTKKELVKAIEKIDAQQKRIDDHLALIAELKEGVRISFRFRGGVEDHSLGVITHSLPVPVSENTGGSLKVKLDIDTYDPFDQDWRKAGEVVVVMPCEVIGIIDPDLKQVYRDLDAILKQAAESGNWDLVNSFLLYINVEKSPQPIILAYLISTKKCPPEAWGRKHLFDAFKAHLLKTDPDNAAGLLEGLEVPSPPQDHTTKRV